MFTEYRPVDSNNLADIRQQMLALATTIQELEEILFGNFGCWEHWSDWYLFEVAVERYKTAQALLNMFTNTPDPFSPTPLEMQVRVYDFTMISASLSRSTSVLGMFEYQEFLTSFNKFCLQADTLYNSIRFC